MTCKEVNQFLADYLDGTLLWRQRLTFNLHLLLCEHCRQYLASYAATVRAAKSLGRVAEPEVNHVPEELVRAILSAQRGKPRTNAAGPSPGADQ